MLSMPELPTKCRSLRLLAACAGAAALCVASSGACASSDKILNEKYSLTLEEKASGIGSEGSLAPLMETKPLHLDKELKCPLATVGMAALEKSSALPDGASWKSIEAAADIPQKYKYFLTLEYKYSAQAWMSDWASLDLPRNMFFDPRRNEPFSIEKIVKYRWGKDVPIDKIKMSEYSYMILAGASILEAAMRWDEVMYYINKFFWGKPKKPSSKYAFWFHSDGYELTYNMKFQW